jgi:hypothetical protein
MFFVDPESRGTAQQGGESIPEGSLATLAASSALLVGGDLTSFSQLSWVKEVARPVHIELRLELVDETCGKALDEQLAYVAESGCSILTPYEIAVLAVRYVARGRSPLFTGRVRTQVVGTSFTSHLGSVPTVVVHYDRDGKLRFALENSGCRKEDLGVLAGLRRKG